MRSRMWMGAALTAAAIIAVFLFSRTAVTAQKIPVTPSGGPPIRVKWEYKVVTQDKLNELGEQGWEVIAVTGGQPYIESSRTQAARTPGDPSSTQNTVKTGIILYHMKRQK